MKLIEGVALSNLCDYSFGDQSGQWGNIHTSFMKDANLTNLEFVSKLFETKKSRNYMTLFIDNIRLYKRHIVEVSESDRPYVEGLMEKSDLLRLCSNFSDMKFIIFTNLEDTPIDEYIFDIIPENVLCISAVNAVAHGGKVIPAPYGLQRAMNPNDDRVETMTKYSEIANTQKSDMYTWLLYISHNEKSHLDRFGIKEHFDRYYWDWVRVDRQRCIIYEHFLGTIRLSKFVLCPRGNAIDCHRNWEVLYMRRVPVMKRNPYFETLFKDYPVLFVDSYFDITKELLIENDYLYQQAQTIDLSGLTLPYFYNKIVKDGLSQ